MEKSRPRIEPGVEESSHAMVKVIKKVMMNCSVCDEIRVMGTDDWQVSEVSSNAHSETG